MKRTAIISIIIILMSLSAKSQYYNGLQMDFGKNRIQYKPYNWRYYPNIDYDVYFYDRGVNHGKYVTEKLDIFFQEYQRYFSVIYDEKVIFVVYNKLSDYRQTNVGLETGNVENNLGGNFQIKDNKIFLFYEGDHQKFDLHLRKAVVSLLVRKILYGTAFTDKLTNTALMNVPPWFENGLISYVAQPYNEEAFNKVKDILETRKKIQFNHLTGEEAEIIGHSFWYFIAENYGEDVISNILYFSKISKSIKNAVYFVLGKSLKKITVKWRDYYELRLKIEDVNIPPSDKEVFKTKKKRIYQNFKISPDGKNIAFVENREGKYKVFLYNTETEKKQKIYVEGQRLEQITDYSYPYLEWNGSGKILAFTTENESNVLFWTYNTEKDELKSKVLPYLSKIMSFSFSPNGYYVVFSAISNGYTDIFLFNILTSKMERITYDLADDLYPAFDKKSSKIIFSSNRTNDTIKKLFNFEDNPSLSSSFDLFYLEINPLKDVLVRMTNTDYSNETQPASIGDDTYLYLSDSTGITNRFILEFDSTISFIDTTVHYRYITSTGQITNYSKSIEETDVQANYIGEILYNDKKYRFFEYPFEKENIKNQKVQQTPTYFRKLFISEKQKEILKQKRIEEEIQIQKEKLDSLRPFFEKKFVTPDSSTIDINNYVFEIEKDTLFSAFFNEEKVENIPEKKFPQMRVYYPTFYMNDLNSKLDFTMLNETYQPFTGGPFIFNPGASLFTTFGADELFNDYKLLGGFKWGFGNSMEYIFSIENLKKRTDKQIVFYRQTLTNEIDYFNIKKSKINQLLLILRYPFNQVSAVKGTLIGKYDRIIQLSTEYNSLTEPDDYQVYTGAKLEYIFDNTRELALNLREGTKFKVFGEFYQQIEGDYDYTTIWGLDYRYYKRIFRNFIYAGRIAGSTSLGSGKLMYYLGGVDNWYDLSFDLTGASFFDNSVNINYEENYLFQAVATNMRGFKQNIRNGHSFALMNHELRLPIIQVFANHPMNSAFWYNLQVIGFFDIGSAWNGWTPYDERNIYNTVTHESSPFIVILDVDRPPFVYSYGFGVRTKIMGYFVRFDWGWGKEGNYSHDRKFHFSLSMDF